MYFFYRIYRLVIKICFRCIVSSGLRGVALSNAQRRAGSTHLVVYTKSSLQRQSFPAALAISDTVARAANVSFVDQAMIFR